MAALAIGSVIAPIVVNRVGVDAAFLAAGLALPAVALISVRRSARSTTTRRWPIPADVALLRGPRIFGPLGPANLERVARQLSPVEVEAGARS